MGRGYRRRKLFVNQELQGKLIFQVFLLSFCGVALFALIFGILTADQLTVSLGGSGVVIDKTPLILAQKLLQAHWLFILLGGAAVSLLTLLVSHRFAGPLYRFEATFQQLNARNLDQYIHLRPKDVGKPLAEQINRFSAVYSADIGQLRALNEQLAECLRCDNQPPPAADLQRATALSEQIASLLNTYRCKGRD